MGLHSKQVAVLAGLGAVGALWFAAGFGDAEPSAREPEREPAPVTSRTDATEARAAPTHAGADGDAPRDGEDLDPKSAEVLRQWKAALTPVLDGAADTLGRADAGRGTPGEASSPSPLTAQANPSPARAASDTMRPDAGEPREETCRPGTVLLPGPSAVLDLVVAIDVSGSMQLHGPRVQHWLTTLEPLLQQKRVDYRLHMLVDQFGIDMLFRAWRGGPRWAPPDAGTHVNLPVSSHDVLDVLTRPPHAGTFWISSLRPNAAVHVVIVTDDDPSPESATDFVRRLTALAGGRLGTPEAPTFGFHALLGMQVGSAGTLLADAPLENRHCALTAGIEYQRIVQQRGGVRASVCNAQSFEAFSHQLIAQITGADSPPERCHLRLPPGVAGHPITSVRALSKNGSGSRQLRLAFDSWNCSEDSYELRGATLRFCPDTCRALEEGGFTTFEVTHRCEP